MFTPTEDVSKKRLINTTGSHVLFTLSVAVFTLDHVQGTVRHGQAQ